jgi:hypothetical protein
VPSPAPTATPAPPNPSAAPTPTPTPAGAPVVAAPTSLTFTNIGNAYAQTVNVAQAGYGGPFVALALGGTPAAVRLDVVGTAVTVTPLQAGATSVVITGGFNQSVSLPVGITVTQLTISSRRR